jgi:hypothetical protein
MPDTCVCPSCGRKLRVPPQLQGQQVQCPECTAAFQVPADSASVSPTAGPVNEGIQTERPARPAPERETGYSERPLEKPARRNRVEWDDEVPYLAPQLPRELPGSGVATAAIVLLAISAFVDLGALVINAVQLQAAPAKKPNMAPLDRDKDLRELFANPMACVQPLVLLPTAIVFLIWIHGAYKNLTFFRVTGLEYSPGWAVGYFFIPIVNFFRPYQVAQEIWRASDPESPLDDRRAWRHSQGSGVITAWWFTWILGGIVGYISGRAALSGVDDNPATKVLDIISDGLSIVAALFAILMIHQLRNRQASKFQRVAEYRPEQELAP